MFRKMSLVGLLIILSVNSVLCAKWGADTIYGGYHKCAIYENTNPKIKMDPACYESITNYNNNGLPISERTYTLDGRLNDSLVYKYSDKDKKEERYNYDHSGKMTLKSIMLTEGNVQSMLLIDYLNKNDTTCIDTNILDEHCNTIISSRYLRTGQGADNKKLFTVNREINKYDDKNTLISKKAYYQYESPGQENIQKETIYKPVYDSLGRLTEYSWFATDGTLKKTFTYEYKADGSKIETQKYDALDDYTHRITIYNKKGQTIEIISLTPSGIRKTLFSMEYDKFGNLIKRNFYFKDKNEVEKTIEFVFSK